MSASFPKWAVQGSNLPTVSPGKPLISEAGAVKSAAFNGDSFAESVAAVVRLPLSDAEKAEAVRRLLNAHQNDAQQRGAQP